MPPGRRTRSRRGCSQCVRVSRKCDESRPVCSRCERLGFACDYSPRFLWKSYSPANSANSANSVVSIKAPIMNNSPPQDCDCTNRLSGSQLLDLFVKNGSRILHWDGRSQNFLVSEITESCRQNAAVRYSVEALMSLCFECCNLSTLTKIDRAVMETKQFFSEVLEADPEVFVTTMILLSQVSMRAGYPWTHQISLILEVEICHWSAQRITSADDAYHILEVLGGLDMDVWIVGRQSEPLHIWATWCMGRQGIEPITGLPRPLLDLIARVSLKEDVSCELRQFLATLPDTPAKPERVWRCFAITALLRVESHLDPCVAGDLALELLELLRLLTSTSVAEDNLHALGWPAFELGIHIQNNDEGGMTLVENIITQLFDQSDEGWRRPQGSLSSLIKRFWKERDDAGHEIAYRTLQSSAIDIGLW